MKDQDFIGWRCALADYESQEESEGNIVSFDGDSTYYFLTHDIESLLEREGCLFLFFKPEPMEASIIPFWGSRKADDADIPGGRWHRQSVP